MLPLLLGLACLACLDATEQTSLPVVQQLAPAPATRLAVLMVDSLDRRDVESVTSLPLLHGRLRDAALHGPVLACVDGVTIPCVSAMITGFDRASGFSPLRNFGAARELAGRSVLGALEARGLRVGYVGDPLLAKALEGLTVVEAAAHEGLVDDDATLRHGLRALAQARLDVIFIHLLALDETAHKFTATSAAYARALHTLDSQIARTMTALREDDHLVVLGDHGHAQSGRHSAGLGTETYAAYFGPLLPRGSQRSLAMTDHARIWARLFGLRWGASSWVDGFFDRRAEPQATREPPALALRPRDRLGLVGVLLLAMGLAVLGAGVPEAPPWRWGARRLIALGLGTTAMLALSLLVPALWHGLATDAGALALALLVGLVGASVLRLAAVAPPDGAARDVGGLLLSGALLWALPTGEPTAGIKGPVLWLMAVLSVLLVRALRAARPRQAAACGACFLVLLLLALVRVRDYLPGALFVQDAGVVVGAVLPACLVVSAVLAVGGARAALITLAGSSAGQLLSGSADRWLIVPCAAILLLTFAAFRRRVLFPAVCFLLPVACSSFFRQDNTQLASVAGTWLLWALLPRLVSGRGLALRAASFTLLMWLSFWTAMSTRVGGVDYDFYFRWLAPGAGATSDAVQQGLLTAAKCMLPAVFGALLAHRAGALPLALLKGAEHLMRVRLALTIVFTVGLSLGRGRADVYLLYDATQEIAFWLLMVAVLGLVAAVRQVGLSHDASAGDDLSLSAG